MTRDEPQGFEFPCAYEIKAMGLDEGGFEHVVVDIIRRHSDRVREDSVRLRASSGGRYVSVSVVIEAESRAQLDAIYDALTAHEKVLMRL